MCVSYKLFPSANSIPTSPWFSRYLWSNLHFEWPPLMAIGEGVRDRQGGGPGSPLSESHQGPSSHMKHWNIETNHMRPPHGFSKSTLTWFSQLLGFSLYTKAGPLPTKTMAGDGCSDSDSLWHGDQTILQFQWDNVNSFPMSFVGEI